MASASRRASSTCQLASGSKLQGSWQPGCQRSGRRDEKGHGSRALDSSSLPLLVMGVDLTLPGPHAYANNARQMCVQCRRSRTLRVNTWGIRVRDDQSLMPALTSPQSSSQTPTPSLLYNLKLSKGCVHSFSIVRTASG